MVTETRDRRINTDAKMEDDDVKRLPHERDESPDGHAKPTRGVMEQAADDLKQGLVDTDLHGMRGQEEAVDGKTTGSAQARPQPGNEGSMRHHDTITPPGDKK